MPATSRRGVLAAAAAVGFALGPRPASAQGAAGGFPDRPLRIIVPSTPAASPT
jgi:tripartite-type tricarboxylate transporter receptor subunit TctC